LKADRDEPKIGSGIRRRNRPVVSGGPGNAVVELTFANLLWAVIGVIEIMLVTVRMFLAPGPFRILVALTIPGLIILGAVADAIYNHITTGHALDAPPPRQ